MRQIKISIAIILITITIVCGFRLLSSEDTWICENGTWQRHGNPTEPIPTSTCAEINVTPSVTTIPIPVTPSPTQASSLNEYSNPKMKFSTKYPKSVDINDNLDGTISFVKWGPTQKTQTELYDGLSVNISQGTLGTNSSLKSLIEADIEQRREQLSPDFMLIKAISPYIHQSNSGGFYFITKGPFGEETYYYLPQINNSFLQISTTVKDPGENGFQSIVDNIISEIVMTD